MRNDLWNTEWQIITAHPIATLYNWQGVGNLPALSISGFTAGTNYPTFYCADTSQLKNGDLITISAAGFPAWALEVRELVPNVSFKAYMPYNTATPASGAIAVRPIQRGDFSTGAGEVHAADGWIKSQSLWFWIDEHSQNQTDGTKRVAAYRRRLGIAEATGYFIPKDIVRSYVGQPYTFKVSVKSAGSWRLFIEDASGITYGNSVSGAGYIEDSLTIPAVTNGDVLIVGIEFTGALGEPYWVAKPIATNSASIPAGYYCKREGWFKPVVKYTPDSYFHSSLTFPSVRDADGAPLSNPPTYGWPFRARPETNGAMLGDVKAINFCWEGYAGSGGKALAWRDQLAIPHNYGNLFYTQAANQMMANNGIAYLSGGDGYVYTATAGQSFANISADISAFYL